MPRNGCDRCDGCRGATGAVRCTGARVRAVRCTGAQVRCTGATGAVHGCRGATGAVRRTGAGVRRGWCGEASAEQGVRTTLAKDPRKTLKARKQPTTPRAVASAFRRKIWAQTTQFEDSPHGRWTDPGQRSHRRRRCHPAPDTKSNQVIRKILEAKSIDVVESIPVDVDVLCRLDPCPRQDDAKVEALGFRLLGQILAHVSQSYDDGERLGIVSHPKLIP